MNNQQLRKTLEELHAELEQTQNVDEDTAAVLADLDQDIRTLLKRPDQELVSKHHGLTASLRAALVNFEGTYPQLALYIERVLDGFNEMGI
ncbi:MAG: DUF4404 family protein [Anaerolineae bacterium]